MVKFLLLIFISILPTKYIVADTLDCRIDDYSRSSYPNKIKMIQSWLPQNLFFNVQGMNISYRNITVTLKTNDDKTMKWEYTRERKNTRGEKDKVKYRFIYFKTNNKFTADIIFPSFRNISDLWGRCTLTTASKQANNNNNIDSPINLAAAEDRLICAKAISYTGKWTTQKKYLDYVKEANKRGLNCGVKDDEKKHRILAAKKERKEKERLAVLEREKRIKAEQERIKKKAEEVARKKKLAEEKARKQRLAEEKARKKQLAEEERKRKHARDKIKKQIINYKRKAVNFYKDIEDYVKAGGKVSSIREKYSMSKEVEAELSKV